MNFTAFNSYSLGSLGRDYYSSSIGNNSHQGGGSTKRIVSFNRNFPNSSFNTTYTVQDLINKGVCSLYNGYSKPCYLITLSQQFFYNNSNCKNIQLEPYNGINYFALSSVVLPNYLTINVNNSSTNDYVVLGIAENEIVTNQGIININNNGYLTNYFFYNPQISVVSIQNYGTINLNYNSIWYQLPIENNGIVNGSYTSTKPTSPSPPW
jgi:hypothetical protein